MADVRALTAKVWTSSNASLATLQASINTFLAGQGSPALRDNAQLIGFDLRFDGTSYFVWVLYTE